MLVALFLNLALAHAESAFRVPVFVTSESGPVPVRELNAKLSERGYARSVPEWMELGEGPSTRIRIGLVDAKIEWARHIVGGSFADAERAFENAPGDLGEAGFETCFLGEAASVGDLALVLADHMYSEHFGLLGWRNRKQTVVYDMTDEMHARVPAIWNRRLRDDSVLLLSRITPEGRDIHVTRLKKCE